MPATRSSVRFKKTVLANGIRIVTEKHPISRAVACGVWVGSGTRDETPEEAGLAHFIEHMVFKRTQHRSAFEISRDMEAVGGELNAFTSRETTTFVTHSLKADLALSLEVLSDLVCCPVFDASDIRKEKQVVIQEIAMAEEQLEDNIFDRYFELAYPRSPLGKPILGTEKSISDMKRSRLMNFYRRAYQPSNILVSVAGHVDHDEVVRLVRKYLKFDGDAAIATAAPQAAKPIAAGFRDVVRRPSEQAHVLVGIPASDFRSPLRFEAYIVNTLLGGGMTSRLYQTIREDRGLAYSVYSQLVTFVDSGVLLTYAGCEPKKAPEVVQLILKDMKRIRKEGITRRELDFFKRQVKGQILLGADDIDSRMNSIAVNEMVFGRYRSVDDVIGDIDRVSVDSVREYLDQYFSEDALGIMVMGQLPEAPTRKWLENL